MELGGNAPFLVFADADLDVAVASAMVAKLRNGGESCTAANRFYVQTPVAEEFARRFAWAMATVKIGPGLDDGVQMGPLVNAAHATRSPSSLPTHGIAAAACSPAARRPRAPASSTNPP